MAMQYESEDQPSRFQSNRQTAKLRSQTKLEDDLRPSLKLVRTIKIELYSLAVMYSQHIYTTECLKEIAKVKSQS